MRATSLRQSLLQYILLLPGITVIIFPMYITITLALKTPAESARSFFALPSSLYLGNFAKVLEGEFWVYATNSLIITGVSVFLVVMIVPAVSFAVSRNFNKRYFKYLYYLMLTGIFIPFQVIMLPVLKHLSSMHLQNKVGIIIMYIVLSFSQGLFLCVGFLKNVPMELDEASRIDGCGILRTFIRVIYPLMTPIIVTLVTLQSLWIWNDFALPLVLLNSSPNYWTLPMFIYNFSNEYSFDYNLAFAAFLLSMLPILAVYGFLQKRIIAGLTEGAIK
ncbi:carbohydrate ABC transporter permease [Paenibacillus doosanensis]|uniref:carbohydrate ABC transporter permease n=1 Tax=Paenibacillus doosanensis TaxID=1229154 RepID=UPI0021805250|nr:carbohydrate ABC transporter permease [Paenibacillus doosanensis]MCS7461450.1 carbohydrate ABC transporter permease [Paenibacillus doosanensis]